VSVDRRPAELVAAALRFRLRPIGFRGASFPLLPISSPRLGARRILDMKLRRPALRGAAGAEAGGLAGDWTLLLEVDEAGNLKSGLISSRENGSALMGCRVKRFDVEGACWG